MLRPTVLPALLLGAACATAATTPSRDLGIEHEWRKRLPLQELEQVMLENPQAENIGSYSRYLSSGQHLAGKNFTQALWTKQKWEEFGIDAEIVEYEIFVNYPLDHRMALLRKNDDGYEVEYEGVLKENQYDKDPLTKVDVVPSFHGYSASGNVTAPIVYVNYCTYSDFDLAQEKKIDIAGKIVLCKYGHIFRGLKVKRAGELGAVGVIIYSDPGDAGKFVEKNGYEVYPDGPAMNPTQIQRGSVQYLSMMSGDPTTPGWASKKGCPRVEPVGLPTIPSIPISYVDAVPLLKALKGHGLNVAKDIDDKRWHTGGLDYKGVEYYTGPTPDDVVVNLYNKMEETFAPMWDVIGTIPGILDNEVIVMGNHRDAWVTGGSGDPTSGSAVVMEIARVLGELKKVGWKPLRTIKLASWDGEEYGLLGSVEWVEDNEKWIRENVVAYLNLDIGSTGPNLRVSSNDLVKNLISDATKRVVDPKSGAEGKNASIYDRWNKQVNSVGSGSDFAPFQDFIGVPSIDLAFTGGPDDPPYMYHSIYDTTYWMENFGDPGYAYHEAMSKIYGLILLKITESPVIQFKATEYAKKLEKTVHEFIESTKDFTFESVQENKEFGKFRFELLELAESIRILKGQSLSMDKWASSVNEDITRHDWPWWKFWIDWKYWKEAKRINDAYKVLDRQFTFSGGLDHRNLFKHVIYAPGRWTGYSGALLPGLVESIEDKDWKNGDRWARIINKTVKDAAKLLKTAQRGEVYRADYGL